MANDNIVDYIQNIGFTLLNHGQSYYKVQEHDSLVINKDAKRFHWNSKGISGNLVDLIQILENKTLDEAIKDVYGQSSKNKVFKNPITNKKASVVKEKEIVPFKLPERNASTKRVIDYLVNKRKLSDEVVDFALKNNLVYQDKKGNAIFVGYDENKEPKFATLRGTYEKVYRGDVASSDKGTGFSIVNKNSSTLYVCESPIDTLSLMTLNKDFDGKNNYLSLNGVSTNALENFLEKNKNIKSIVTALDRDEAGIKATKKIWKTYKDSYQMGNYFLFVKDVNEQLINMKAEIKVIVNDCEVSDPFNKGEIINLKDFNNRMNEIDYETYINVDIFKGKISLMESILCLQDENKGFDLYKTIKSKKDDFDNSIDEHKKMIESIVVDDNDEVTKKEISDMKMLISKFKHGSDILMNSLRKELNITNEHEKVSVIGKVEKLKENVNNQKREQQNNLSKEVER